MRSTGERRFVPHATRFSLALVVLLLLLPLATSQGAASSTGQWHIPGPTTKLYIGQSARLSTQIPAAWTVPADNRYDYSGEDGFVRSVPLAASNLDDACATVSGTMPQTTIRMTRWRDRPACVIHAPASTSDGHPSVTALVVTHPHPFTSFGTTYSYAALFTDPVHFPGIATTLSFDPIRVTPAAYTQAVIDLVQARSLFRADVDWQLIRREATYVTDWEAAHAMVGLLINMLRAAGDNHSLYLSPVENAGYATTTAEPPSGRRLIGDVGYVQLTGIWPDPATIQRYVRTTRSVIEDIDRAPTCGWIVDLRRNNGGDVYPMIQGISPLLGDGRIFGFRYADGSQDWASVENGTVLLNGHEIVPSIDNHSTSALSQQNPPVAVLIGPGTASAGELTAIAFIGRPDTRLFGAPTGGYTTGNYPYPLFDGYTLLLAGVYDTDRNGNVYEHGVTPEVKIEEVGEFGTENDPVIKAATAWLTQQPACRTNATATLAA